MPCVSSRGKNFSLETDKGRLRFRSLKWGQGYGYTVAAKKTRVLKLRCGDRDNTIYGADTQLKYKCTRGNP